MTAEDLAQRLRNIASFLDIVAPFIPGEIDDRAILYVRAVADSPALLELLAEDLPPILDRISADQYRQLALANSSTGEEAIGDGSILRLLLELLPVILEILKNLPFARPRRTAPVQVTAAR